MGLFLFEMKMVEKMVENAPPNFFFFFLNTYM